MMLVGDTPTYPAQATSSVHDNYMDPSGAINPFAPGLNNDGVIKATYSNNTNMTTGQALPNNP
jgi:hypothetical protein